MTDSATAINVNHLSKQYPGGLRGNPVLAVSDLSLEIKPGEIFGLLGPNGAGKTTLIKILLGALRPTSGSASINGHDIKSYRAREKSGFLPENHRFPPYLTGMQMLMIFGGMRGMSRSAIRTQADELLKLVNMERWRNTKIKKYSKGMMQRLGLAQAILGDPDLIFLDEPTDGVDPIGRHEIRTVLLDLKKRGKTIFLNSHLLAEVEAVCDRVAVLDKGKLIKTGPVSGLIETKPAYRIETADMRPEMPERILNKFPQAKIDGKIITITFDEPRRINDLIDYMRADRVDLLAVSPVKVSLEESFLTLLKEGTDNE
ncbi:MAG: ABC transporter ATP-binding protein [FCB group bacterium]|nr:ABC transporter ATP-binding protein [FCB group bacterium]